MKKAKDEMRTEYKRSDFARLERGKFYAGVAKGTAVALLDPPIAKAFPTSKAVNDALHGLLALTGQTITHNNAVNRTPGETRWRYAVASWPAPVTATVGRQG
jgi:hypothetical protein